MFEHLDDEVGFAPDAAFRTAVRERGAERRRRRRVVAGAALAAVAVVAAAGVIVERFDRSIERVAVESTPSLDGSVNFLLVGVDGTGAAGPVRADTLVVVRLDPDGAVSLLSVPRDLVAGTVPERMALRAGAGLDAAVVAVQDALAIPIDHAAQLDLDGFVALVDAVGGVAVRIDTPIVDPPTGTDLRPTPCTVLDGGAALGLVRARHVEGDPTGDLGRTARQRAFLLAALAQTGPADIPAVAAALADHAVLDAGLDLPTLLDLGRRLDAATDVRVVALPVEEATTDAGATVLVPADGYAAAAGSFGGAATGGGAAPLDAPSPGIGPCA